MESLTNGMGQVKEKRPGLGDKVEKLNHTAKENDKCDKA